MVIAILIFKTIYIIINENIYFTNRSTHSAFVLFKIFFEKLSANVDVFVSNVLKTWRQR